MKNVCIRQYLLLWYCHSSNDYCHHCAHHCLLECMSLAVLRVCVWCEDGLCELYMYMYFSGVQKFLTLNSTKPVSRKVVTLSKMQ